jgi:hypothetical protein
VNYHTICYLSLSFWSVYGNNWRRSVAPIQTSGTKFSSPISSPYVSANGGLSPVGGWEDALHPTMGLNGVWISLAALVHYNKSDYEKLPRDVVKI